MHSQEFISQCKKKLIDKKNSIEKEISELSSRSSVEGEHLPIYEDIGREFADDAFERELYQKDLIVLHQLDEHLALIDEALQRIEKGVYGKSVYSGKDISAERLLVYPEARGLADEEE
jgi:RNA polymerase-binding transcription factor DksA